MSSMSSNERRDLLVTKVVLHSFHIFFYHSKNDWCLIVVVVPKLPNGQEIVMTIECLPSPHDQQIAFLRIRREGGGTPPRPCRSYQTDRKMLWEHRRDLSMSASTNKKKTNRKEHLRTVVQWFFTVFAWLVHDSPTDSSHDFLRGIFQKRWHPPRVQVGANFPISLWCGVFNDRKWAKQSCLTALGVRLTGVYKSARPVRSSGRYFFGGLRSVNCRQLGLSISEASHGAFSLDKLCPILLVLLERNGGISVSWKSYHTFLFPYPIPVTGGLPKLPNGQEIG